MKKKVFVIVILVVIIVFAVMLGIFFKKKSDNNENISNSTTPYIPDGVNVATNESDTEIPADNIEFNRNKENVKIEVLPDTITKEKAEILITDNNEDHYGWGVEFKVQKKINGEWKDLEYISDDLTWTDIAYSLNENNQLTQKLNIAEYYGELEKGTYRIVKPVYDKGYIDIYSNEFEIK